MKHLIPNLASEGLYGVLKTILAHFATNNNHITEECIDAYTQLIVLSGEYHSAYKYFNMNFLPYGKFNEIANRIRMAIVNILNALHCETCKSKVQALCYSVTTSTQQPATSASTADTIPPESELYEHIIFRIKTQPIHL